MKQDKIIIAIIAIVIIGFGYFMYSTWPNYQSNNNTKDNTESSGRRWVDDFKGDSVFYSKVREARKKNPKIKIVFTNEKGVDTVLMVRSDSIMNYEFPYDDYEYSHDARMFHNEVMHSFERPETINRIKFICDRYDEVIMVVERKGLIPESYSMRLDGTRLSKKRYYKSDDEYNIRFRYRVIETILRKCNSN
jgi:hypothetical protein